MARFAITVLLLAALALWNLPEFQKWGRHDLDSDALMQSQTDRIAKSNVARVTARCRDGEC